VRTLTIIPDIPTAPLPWRRRDLIGLVIVFAVALGLRLAWPGVIDFKLDEASNSRLALAWAQGHGGLPLHGVTSSTGVPTPPFATWVLAVPYFFGPDPLLAAAWFALLSALSVAVGYWLAHRYFGFYAAIVTGVLHAFSPWSVYHARKVWTPGAQPLFAVLTVATGAVGFIEGKKRWQAAHVFLLVWTVGVHLSSLPLVLVSVFLLVTNRRSINWRWVGGGAAAIAVVCIPFVIGIIQNPDIVMTEDADIQGHEVKVSPAALKLTAQNTLWTGLCRWADPDEVELVCSDPPGGAGVQLAALGILAATFAIAWKHRRSASGKFGLVALVWLFSYTAMFTVQWSPIHPHYYIALWPAPYLVIAIALASSFGRGSERQTVIYIGAFLAIAAFAFAVPLHKFFTFAGSHYTPGDFSTPLGMKMDGAHAALDLLDETDAAEIIVVGEGDRPYQHEGPGTFEVMLYNAPHRFVDSAHSVVLPDHPAAVLVQPDVDWAAVPWYEATSKEVERIALREDEGEYVLYHYTPDDRAAVLADFTPVEPPNLLDNGARIVAYRWGSEHVDIAFEVARAPGISQNTLDNYHFTVYLYDPAAEKVLAQSDGPAHWAAYWQPGDLIVTRLPLPAAANGAPDTAELRAAMYLYPDITRAFVLDEGGATVSDSVLLRK
jgi:hypothetical protein